MGSPQKPPPYALVFREKADESWTVWRIPEHKLAAWLAGGWTLLISEAQVRASDIEETYRSDRDRPFNPPHR